MRYEDLHFSPMPELGEMQKRNMAAAKSMSDEDAARLWEIISRDFNEAAMWALIPEEEPDEFDLEMLREIENDPDCHIFAPAEEVEAYLLGTADENTKTA